MFPVQQLVFLGAADDIYLILHERDSKRFWRETSNAAKKDFVMLQRTEILSKHNAEKSLLISVHGNVKVTFFLLVRPLTSRSSTVGGQKV